MIKGSEEKLSHPKGMLLLLTSQRAWHRFTTRELPAPCDTTRRAGCCAFFLDPREKAKRPENPSLELGWAPGTLR